MGCYLILKWALWWDQGFNNMIINRLKPFLTRRTPFLRIFFMFSDNKITKTGTSLERVPTQQPPQVVDGKQIITQLPASQLFELKQNTTPVPGNSQEREFSSLSQLQREIIQKKQFNLLDKRIKLQQMGISSIMEENLTKVDLGEVNIKNKNQILLQDIDPNNIPEDMDIVFESKKKLTLVGKRIKKGENKGGNVMKVSDSSFEEKSLAEFRGEEFKVGKARMTFNRSEFLRFSIMLLPFLFIFLPFLDANNEINITRESILEIEREQAETIRKVKKYYYRKILMENPSLL